MEFTTEAKERLSYDMECLLDEYYHRSTEEGRSVLLDTWFKNNAPIMEKFSKHPNWDAENFRIVFSNNYVREFNVWGIRDFLEWALDVIQKDVVNHRIDSVNGYDYNSMAKAKRTRSSIKDMLSDISCYANILANYGEQMLVGDKTIEEWKMVLHELNCTIRAFDKLVDHNNSPYVYASDWNGTYIVPRESKEAYDVFQNFTNTFSNLDYVDNKVTTEILNKAQRYFPDIKLVGVGSTIAKLFRRICYSIPCLVDWSKTTTSTWETINPNTGEIEQHSRDKVHTLESKLSELGDATSPLYITRHTVISFNPLDYLTMSFGHKWASCQTIDKANQRRADNNYHGMYCSGTLSYMLDTSSIIFYTVDQAYNGNAYETQDKMQRCMFHLSPDGNILIQGRVYPDGRDGGDASLSAQFRAVMQQVVSDVYDKSNFWTIKKGTSACEEYSTSKGTHYRDYKNYSDCNVSVRQNVTLEQNHVEIGHDPIDPETGNTHNNPEAINKYYNGEEYIDDEYARECYMCGHVFNSEEEGIYCDDNGRWYCCGECANDNDVHYCTDTYEYHDEYHSFYDNYVEDWQTGEPEYDGFDRYGSRVYFASCENMERAGFIDCEDGYCYPEDECYYDAYSSEWFHDEGEMVEIDGKCYQNEENAEADGWVKVDDEWYSIDDATEIDGEYYLLDDERVHYDEWSGEHFLEDDDSVHVTDDLWFKSEDNARAMGYAPNEFGEWIMADTDNDEEIA